MIYVYLTNNIVTDVARVPPATIFNPSYAAQFIEAPDEVTHGWAFDGTNWTAPTTPSKTPEEIQAEIVAATQARLDAFARTRHYDDIKSASDYAGCSVPRFDAEGTYARDARAETWEALYTMLAEVQAGTRPMPAGFADIEPELPALVWPST